MKTVTKIVLLIALSVLILVGVANWISLRQTKETLEERTRQLLDSILDFSVAQVQENSITVKRFTEVISHNSAISKALYLDTSVGVNQVLNQMVQVFPFCTYVAIVTLEGDVFAVNTQDGQGEKIPSEELLGRSVAKNPLFWVPPATSEVTVGDPGPDPFFPLLDNATGMSQWFVAPVFKESEQVGWVVLSYNWQDELSALLQGVREKLTLLGKPVTQLHFVDEKGSVVVRSRSARDESTGLENQVRREGKLLMGKTPMKLAIAIDASWVNAPVAMMRTYFFALTAVLTILMVAILYFILEKTFLKKLKLLETGAKQLISGNLAYRLPSLGTDELGLFASTFNSMGESLYEASEKLEQKVEERTAQLQDSELKFRTVADFTYGWEYWVGPDGSLLYVSPSCERITGYRPQEFADNPNLLSRIIHPADKPIVGDHLDHIDTSGPVSMEFRIVTRAGEDRWIAHVCQPVFDDTGKFLGRRVSNRDVTDRKSAEFAVQKSQEQLTLAIEGSGAGLWDWRVQTGETVFNERWAQIIGYTLEELEPINIDTWIKYCHPDDLQKSDELLNKHFAGETLAYECEARMRHKDGHWIWVLDRGKVTQWDGDGKPVRITGTHLDITGRKQMEQALADSEQRFRSLFESHSAVMLLVDQDSGAIVDANLAAADYYGYSHDHLKQMSIADINCLLPDQVVDHRQQATMHRQNFFVFPHRLANGDVRTVEVYSSPIEIKESRLLFSIVHDITERQRQEEELHKYRERLEDLVNQRTEQLKKSELHFRNLVENAADAIYVYDWNSDRIVDCNKQACDSLGYTRDELLQLTISDFDLNFDKEKIDSITGALTLGEPIAVNGMQKRKDGTTFPVEARIGLVAPLEYGNIVGIVRDVTDRIRAQEERESLQKQLFQSQKMEAVGTLAAGIAHDFNNILFAITGYGEIALDEVPKDSFAYRNMKLALNAADRASDLVRHILTFSREGDQQKGTILLGPIVKESLKFLKSSLPDSIEIRRLIKADLHPVHADPTQMHQLFMNLMTNAYHAMKEAGGLLTVRLDEVDVTEEIAATTPGLLVGTYNKLRVSDTGHGMSPDVLERMFDPFFTTKQSGEGTGLGLSVVDGIVKNHGGVIRVESTQGRGTTFEVYLPIVKTDAPIRHAETVVPVSPVSLKRILFVDDDKMVTGAAQGNLEQLGYEVIPENDPVRALALFEESPHSFDLVITDISMPKMTGVQLCERIHEIRSDMPVVAITGYADLMNKDEVLDSGFLDIIFKPIRRKALADTIGAALSQKD